ncbi:hypothetical protein [Polaromonas sp. CG9_12]|nr:hypothetical protein [Polaromonas sp. CG9_12]
MPESPVTINGIRTVQMPAPMAQALPEIRVEVRRPGAATVTVNWPVQYASECAAWLRECLR